MANKNKSEKKSGNHHHNFFESTFETGRHVKSLFKLAFTPEQLQLFDLRTITIDKRNWLDNILLKSYSADLVVTLRLKDGNPVDVAVIVEHKSHPDYDLMYQLLSYLSMIYAKKAADVVLPPVVVYHGQQFNWPGWRTFQQFQSGKLPDSIFKQFGTKLIDFGIVVVNLRDAAMRKRMEELPLNIRLSLEVMADIWDANERTWVKWAKQSQSLTDETRVELMQRNLKYLRNLHPKIELNKIMNAVDTELRGDDLMRRQVKEWGWLTEEEAAAHQKIGIEQGVQQGIEQGIELGVEQATREITMRLIGQGLNDRAISQCTGLTLDEVGELRNSV